MYSNRVDFPAPGQEKGAPSVNDFEPLRTKVSPHQERRSESLAAWHLPRNERPLCNLVIHCWWEAYTLVASFSTS